MSGMMHVFTKMEGIVGERWRMVGEEVRKRRN
jgi:hypothetical protein